MSAFSQSVQFQIPGAGATTTLVAMPGSFEAAHSLTHSANVGTYVVGETLNGTGGAAGKQGIILSVTGSGAGLVLVIIPLAGVFAAGDTHAGATSGATGTVGLNTAIVSLGGGMVQSISVENTSAAIATVAVHDARDANGLPFQAALRAQYEVDLAIVAQAFGGIRGTAPKRFECHGLALTAGGTLAAHNKLWSANVAATDELVADGLELRADTGMIVAISASADPGTDINVSVTYKPRVLGRWRTKMQRNRYHLAHS